MKPGVILKILCCSAELIMINTLGVYLFKLRTFPDWANTTEIFSAQGSHYDSLWTAASNATAVGNFSLTTTLLPILQNSTVLWTQEYIPEVPFMILVKMWYNASGYHRRAQWKTIWWHNFLKNCLIVQMKVLGSNI